MLETDPTELSENRRKLDLKMGDLPPRFTLAQLEAMPTLDQGHFDNLKWESANHPKYVKIRVWLSRMTKADGMPCDNMVTVECFGPPAPGQPDWLRVEEYEAK